MRRCKAPGLERGPGMLFSVPMPTSQEIPGALNAVPGWLPEATFWLAVALLFVGLAIAAGVWTLVLRMREVQREASRLAVLDELQHKLSELVAHREDLDLRRVEHLLIDLRDTQVRLEDALLRSLEAPHRTPEGDGAILEPAAGREAVGERVVNRLLALGYERVQIVTRPESLGELARQDGEVLVEARRDGVLHKGRVVIRAGRLADVEINPTYSIFP